MIIRNRRKFRKLAPKLKLNGNFTSGSEFFKKDSETKETKESICLRGLWWSLFFSLAAISFYWIYQVLNSYMSQPVTSSVSLVKNNSFTWPSISICPHQNCYNQTALELFSQEYNLTPFGALGFLEFQPFNFTEGPGIGFDWEKYNYSEILAESKYREREDIVSSCFYLQTDVMDESCWNISSALGNWSSYHTQDGFCHTFNPIPAVNVANYIKIALNFDFCEYIDVAIHPFSEKFYMQKYPSIATYNFQAQQSSKLSVSVQEFKKISRKSSECEKSPEYSQTECINIKTMQYIIEISGCYIPEVTGYPVSGNYPICNNGSAITNFEINRYNTRYTNLFPLPKNLQKEIDKCLDPCDRYIYRISRTNYSSELGNESISYIRLEIDGDGMLFLKVTENFLLSLDMLVSDIGGTLGLFLGFSGLSLVPLLENIYKKLKNSLNTV